LGSIDQDVQGVGVSGNLGAKSAEGKNVGALLAISKLLWEVFFGGDL
jgi:hypothetical protein